MKNKTKNQSTKITTSEKEYNVDGILRAEDGIPSEIIHDDINSYKEDEVIYNNNEIDYKLAPWQVWIKLITNHNNNKKGDIIYVDKTELSKISKKRYKLI